MRSLARAPRDARVRPYEQGIREVGSEHDRCRLFSFLRVEKTPGGLSPTRGEWALSLMWDVTHFQTPPPNLTEKFPAPAVFLVATHE